MMIHGPQFHQRRQSLRRSVQVLKLLLISVSASIGNAFSQDAVAQSATAEAGVTVAPPIADAVASPIAAGLIPPTVAAEAAAEPVASNDSLTSEPSSKVILIETTSDSNRSEVIRKVVEALEKNGSAKRATDDRLGKPVGYLAEIGAKRDTDFKLVVAVIKELQKAGIQRMKFRRATVEGNSVEVTAPADVTWHRIRQIERAIAKHPTFQGRVLVAGTNGSVTSTLQTAWVRPEDTPGDANEPERVRVFYLKNTQAEEAAKILEQLYLRPGREDSASMALSIAIDQRLNSIIVRTDDLMWTDFAEIEALMARLDTETPKPADKARSATHPKTEKGVGVPIPGLRSGLGPLAFDFAMQSDTDDDRIFSFYIGDAHDGETADQLRATYEDLEQKSRALAEQLREPLPDSATGDKLKRQLRDAVRQAFLSRQKLQRAELSEFAKRLQRIQQSLEMRDRIAEQVIDRRVDELLDPSLTWDSDNADSTAN